MLMCLSLSDKENTVKSHYKIQYDMILPLGQTNLGGGSDFEFTKNVAHLTLISKGYCKKDVTPVH